MIDFDLSRPWTPGDGRKMSKRSGSLAYCSPDVFKEDYTNKCDLWSVGVVGFMLLSGTMPFDDEPEEDESIFSIWMSSFDWLFSSPVKKTEPNGLMDWFFGNNRSDGCPVREMEAKICSGKYKMKQE